MLGIVYPVKWYEATKTDDTVLEDFAGQRNLSYTVYSKQQLDETNHVITFWSGLKEEMALLQLKEKKVMN